jgi:hypothetical protein
MHPVTRLGRVIQQLRSFGDLHVAELEDMAQQLEASGASEMAARVRMFRDMQRDEGQIVLDELLDIRTEVSATATPQDVPPAAPALTAGGVYDPAINSPKRAKWLAEQAAEAERLKQPFSRRDFFGRGASKPEDL